LGYFGTGYVSWVLADLLLDRPNRQPDNPYAKFALPVIASFVMVTWDLVMDPSSSTLGQFWIWHNGGGFFGVPLSNYLGWYLTVWLFYQAFALYLGLKQNPVFTNPSKTFWYQAIVMYLSIGFVATIFPSFTNVTDRAGRVWWTGDMAETAVIFFLFSMVFICAFSLIKVFQINDPPGQG
jgi:putative membrane protein